MRDAGFGRRSASAIRLLGWSGVGERTPIDGVLSHLDPLRVGRVAAQALHPHPRRHDARTAREPAARTVPHPFIDAVRSHPARRDERRLRDLGERRPAARDRGLAFVEDASRRSRAPSALVPRRGTAEASGSGRAPRKSRCHALGAARRVDEPAQRVEPGAPTGEHDGRGRPCSARARGGSVELRREQQGSHARAAQGQFERLRVSASRSHGPLASKITTASERATLGATRFAAASHGRPAPREAEFRRRRLAWPPLRAPRRPGSRTSSTVRSTERTARLSSRTRSASASSKRLMALPAAAPGSRDRCRAPGRWRSPTRCCGSPRRPTGAPRSRSSSNCRCPPAVRRGSGGAEPALPGAQRVRADAEHGRSSVGA